MSDPEKPGGMVKSDETLFSIIEGLYSLEGAGVTELADHLGMAKSAAHKHLKTLEHHDYVEKRATKYHLSFQFLRLGGFVRNRNHLCRLAKPKVHNIATDLEVVASFSIEENGTGIVVHQINELEIDIRGFIGAQFDLHLIAQGKALLAQLSDDRIRDIIDRRGLTAATEQSIDSIDEVLEEVDVVRDRGYAVSIEEAAEGEASVGVAVEDPDTGTLGAYAISCPVTNTVRRRLESEYVERLFEVVSETRYQLSA